MSLYEGLKREGKKLFFAGRGDTCYDCLQDLMHKDKVDSGVATRKLRGSIEGKLVRKMPQSQYVICEDHIKKEYEEIEKYYKEKE